MFQLLKLDGLSLDDNDLEGISRTLYILAAANNLPISQLALMLNDLNVYGQMHGLDYSSEAVTLGVK